MPRPGDTRIHRGPDRSVRPLPVLAWHVVCWVVIALVLAVIFSDGTLTDLPSPEPLIVFGLFGAMVGFLTGLLHVGVRVVRG